MISKPKTSLIQVARHQLGLEDDDYRTILRSIAGVESSRDLDEKGFAAVMHHFNRLGFESTSKKRNFGDRAGMATPGQVAKIRKLWNTYTGGAGTDATLGKWLEKTFKVSSVRFIPADAAFKVIGALNTMIARHGPAAEGDGQAA